MHGILNRLAIKKLPKDIWQISSTYASRFEISDPQYLEYFGYIHSVYSKSSKIAYRETVEMALPPQNQQNDFAMIFCHAFLKFNLFLEFICVKHFCAFLSNERTSNFPLNWGNSATEVYEIITSVYVDDAISRPREFDWCLRLKTPVKFSQCQYSFGR